MAIPTTILNARVKQKIATDAYWISIEDELGIILEGEQAFVYDDDGNAVNFKVGDGTKKYSELPFFIAYFNNVTNCKVLSYLNQSANLTIPIVFRNLTTLDTLYFFNNSGSAQTIKIGTTDGGSEICEIEAPNDIVSINIDYLFTDAQTVYITGLTGVNYSMFIKYYQLDEAPAIPNSSTPTVTKRWAPGTIYSFIPLYVGHVNDVWDLINGYGKVGTDYEGAVLFNTPALPIDLSDFYLKGHKTGDTIGGDVGANSFTIEKANLPAEGLEMFVNGVNSTPEDKPGVNDPVAIENDQSSQSRKAYQLHKATGTPTIGKTGNMGLGEAVEFKPRSKSVLFFTGVATT